MNVTLTAADLVAFEDEVAARFADRQIKAPVHLSGGNEGQLIRIFREHVHKADYVLSSWRSHYHCLLKGVPRAEVMGAILAGRSISLCFPNYRVLSSAVVGGTAPIAVGLAMGIRRKGEQGRRKVVCFLGDMAAESGIVHESIKYALGHDLPVLWVVEDNGVSVTADTREVWGVLGNPQVPWVYGSRVIHYQYKLTRPHCGVGRWIAF